jgi:hypothetical protein
MDQIIETSELLMEVEILSKKEKDEIIENIDNDLFYYYQNFFDIKKFHAGATGLKTPLLIILLAFIITASVFFISNRTFLSFENDFFQYRPADLPQTEWGVLNYFMEETSAKLERKEQEILGYKQEIKNYDLRLQQLRELIVAKEEVEKRLSAEREILRSNGFSDDVIISRIDSLEDSLISNLSPELVAFYDSSIEEINEKIDQLLIDKSISEEGLKQSLSEKQILETEYNILLEKGDQNKSSDSELLDVIEKMNRFSDLTQKYEKERLFEKQVNRIYMEILENYDENENPQVKNQLETLQEMIQNEPDPYKIQTIGFLQEYINGDRTFPQILLRKETDYNALVSELDLLTGKILQEEGTSKYAQNGVNISSLISDIPAVAEALSLVNQKKFPETGNWREFPGNSVAPAGPGSFLGSISYINFDTVIIKSIQGIAVPVGESFAIYRKDDLSGEFLLGCGKITNFSDELIFGKIESIKNIENRLEPGDRVYLNQE